MQKQQIVRAQPTVPSSTPLSRHIIDFGKLRRALRTFKGQFIALATCLVLLAIVQALVVSLSYSRSATDLSTIDSGSIPSVNAAQAITQYIEDIDAKAADYLATASLTATVPCSIVGTDRNPGQLTVHDCDNLNIDAEMILANRELFNAAHNVTFPGERTAVERITAGFEEYAANIAIMRHEYDMAANKTDPQDPHLQKARQAYQAANDVLQKHITQQPTVDANGTPVFNEPSLPTCNLHGQVVAGTTWALGSIEDNLNCLSDINKTHLDAAYNDTISFLGGMVTLTLLFGAIFCVLLLSTTWRMARASHRIINPGLTLALLVGIIFSLNVVSLFSEMSGQHGDFGQMVQDDYNSVYYAAQLKRFGTAANADESRWLIAMAFSDQAEADHWYQDWQANTAQVISLIDRAQNNRTYPEEDQPLADIHENWQQYVDIDGQMRAAATNTTDPKRIITAETISTGNSNRTFDGFSQAVDHLSQANQLHYNQTRHSTQGSLMIYTILSAILFPLIGLGALWGVATRLKDF